MGGRISGGLKKLGSCCGAAIDDDDAEIAAASAVPDRKNNLRELST
jgi:hypothetical protein